MCCPTCYVWQWQASEPLVLDRLFIRETYLERSITNCRQKVPKTLN